MIVANATCQRQETDTEERRAAAQTKHGGGDIEHLRTAIQQRRARVLSR
jgi:hypothetical protein